MAESFGGCTAIEASYSLGVAGHIKWRRNIDGAVFRCTMSMQDGLTLSKLVEPPEMGRAPVVMDDVWERLKERAQELDIQQVMPDENKFGWDAGVFIAWWAGIAAGMAISADRNRAVEHG